MNTKTTFGNFHFADLKEVAQMLNITMSTLEPFVEKVLEYRKEHFPPNPSISISYVDFAWLDMAENLYLSSFKKFGIENYLFVTPNAEAEELLHKKGINTVALWEEHSTRATDLRDIGNEPFHHKKVLAGESNHSEHLH